MGELVLGGLYLNKEKKKRLVARMNLKMQETKELNYPINNKTELQ